MSRRRIIAIAYFLSLFVLSTAFFFRLPVLWDYDSYYHLAVARLYATDGLMARIPWARMSLLSNGADKDFLFHLLLVPFASMPDAALGGRVALGFLNAAIGTAIALLAWRTIHRAALLVPLFLWLAAPLFFAREVRLRPELLALLLLLLAIAAAAHRRYALLGIVAFGFAGAYTAFQVFLALSFLWFLWDWRKNRRADVSLITAPVLGVIAGLALRPHPIENLRLWFVQNVLFFVHMSRLDVGNEILPPRFPEALYVSLAWIGGLAVLIFVANVGPTLSRSGPTGESDPRITWFTTIAALLFAILFLRMLRMANYAFPLVTLSVLFAIAGRVRERSAAAILAVAALLGTPLTFNADRMKFLALAREDVTELDWSAFGRAVPRDAKIAAPWSESEAYAFWAPQGRYLNVLDPIFMFIPHPREYEAQRRLFDGNDPDVPRTVKGILQSDFIAIDWTLASPRLVQRLRDDPRLETVYGGYNALFRVRSPRDIQFVTTWSSPGDNEFVDASRFVGNGCATLSHVETTTSRVLITYEFAPWGPSTMSIDGRPVVAVTSPQYAILGRGARFEASLDPGNHTIEVRTCRADDLAGFYLLERARHPASSR